MIRFFQDKPLHVRIRYAIIATGSIAFILILVMVYTYVNPPASKTGPEEVITSSYATLLEKIQSLFSSK